MLKIATPSSAGQSEVRTCVRCGRRRQLADGMIASVAGAWTFTCLDREACEAAALGASKARSRSLVDALLGRRS